MPIDFDNLFETLKTGVTEIAKKSIGNYLSQAQTDGHGLIEMMKTDIQKWTQQLANGTLSKDDFEYNLLGEKDGIAMNALKEAGFAEIAVDQFKKDILDLVKDTVFNLIP